MKIFYKNKKGRAEMKNKMKNLLIVGLILSNLLVLTKLNEAITLNELYYNEIELGLYDEYPIDEVGMKNPNSK